MLMKSDESQMKSNQMTNEVKLKILILCVDNFPSYISDKTSERQKVKEKNNNRRNLSVDAWLQFVHSFLFFSSAQFSLFDSFSTGKKTVRKDKRCERIKLRASTTASLNIDNKQTNAEWGEKKLHKLTNQKWRRFLCLACSLSHSRLLVQKCAAKKKQFQWSFSPLAVVSFALFFMSFSFDFVCVETITDVYVILFFVYSFICARIEQWMNVKTIVRSSFLSHFLFLFLFWLSRQHTF